MSSPGKAADAELMSEDIRRSHLLLIPQRPQEVMDLRASVSNYGKYEEMSKVITMARK